MLSGIIFCCEESCHPLSNPVTYAASLNAVTTAKRFVLKMHRASRRYSPVISQLAIVFGKSMDYKHRGLIK